MIVGLLKKNRDLILECAARHGARNVRLFGSAARGGTTADSDVDFLVDMDKGRTLLVLAGLHEDLEDLLGRHVDVVTERGLSPYMKDRILAEAVPL